MKDFFVGSRQLTVRDEMKNISFPVLVQYPTDEVSRPIAFGPYAINVSPDAEIIGEQFPLVIISHGNGGSHLLYRTISTHLAKNGYIVAMPEHYGNNRNNNTLEHTTENLLSRPRHVSLTIDFLLSDNSFSRNIARRRIAVIGHSMGGYTALALAGGVPRTKDGLVLKVASDSRVKAIVLLAPGTGWFMNSLSGVAIPILMLTAEHDPVTPKWNGEIVLNYITEKSKLTFKEIENAGHYSFLSPFPATMKNPNFLPSTDPTGFDREKFHEQLPIDILDFLNENLNEKFQGFSNVEVK